MELPHHTVRGSGERSFERRLRGGGCRHCGFTIFAVPAVGLRVSLAYRPDLLSSPPHAIAAVSLVQRKLVPSIHMRWRMTASLRASATRAFVAPRRLATAMAQLFSGDMRTVRLSITLAASWSARPEHQRTSLLSLRLHRHKAHARALGSLADRPRIRRVVLLPLHERLDVRQRDQPHIVSQASKLPAPVMRTGTRLQRHQTKRLPTKERQQLGPVELAAEHRTARSSAP